MRATTANRPETATAVANLIRFLETGAAPDGLFTPDAFADLSLPHWRIQAGTAEEILAIRSGSHPFPGTGPRRARRADRPRVHRRVRGAVGPRRPALGSVAGHAHQQQSSQQTVMCPRWPNQAEVDGCQTSITSRL
jgi:hypothetical protein